MSAAGWGSTISRLGGIPSRWLGEATLPVSIAGTPVRAGGCSPSTYYLLLLAAHAAEGEAFGRGGDKEGSYRLPQEPQGGGRPLPADALALEAVVVVRHEAAGRPASCRSLFCQVRANSSSPLPNTSTWNSPPYRRRPAVGKTCGIFSTRCILVGPVDARIRRCGQKVRNSLTYPMSISAKLPAAGFSAQIVGTGLKDDRPETGRCPVSAGWYLRSSLLHLV